MEAFLDDGGQRVDGDGADASVLDQRGGAVVIEGGNAVDAHAAGSIGRWCR